MGYFSIRSIQVRDYLDILVNKEVLQTILISEGEEQKWSCDHRGLLAIHVVLISITIYLLSRRSHDNENGFNYGSLLELMEVELFPFMLVYGTNIIMVVIRKLLFIFQLSFTFGLLPSVLLTYIGQAAYLRKHTDMRVTDIPNVFFNSIPSTWHK